MGLASSTSAPKLAAGLKTGSLAEREVAAKRICEVAGGIPERRELLAVAGVIPLLVGLISEGSEKGKEWAAAALGHLALHPENKDKIVEAGGLRALIKLGKDGSPGAKGAVATALSSLSSKHAANQSKIADAGAFPMLVAMARNEDGSLHPKAQAWAAACIGNLAVQHPPNQELAAKCGAIEAIVDLLKFHATRRSVPAPGQWQIQCRFCQKRDEGDDGPVDGGMTDKGKEWLVKALSSLGYVHAANQAKIGEAGAMAPLVALMKSAPTAGKFEAARALCNLVNKCTENRRRVVEAGAIPELAEWAKSKASMTRSELSVGLLSSLATQNRANQDAIAASGVIPDLAWLLHAGNDTAKLHAAAALLHLAEDNAANKTLIGEAGALLGLVKLAEGSNLPHTRSFASKALVTLAKDNPENRQMIEDLEVTLPRSNGLASTGMKLTRLEDADKLREALQAEDQEEQAKLTDGAPEADDTASGGGGAEGGAVRRRAAPQAGEGAAAAAAGGGAE